MYNCVYHSDMSAIINITDFRNNIATYIDKIIYHRETYLLKKGKAIVARITAYSDDKTDQPRLSATLRELAGLWADIDRRKLKRVFEAIDQQDSQKGLALTV
jgi:antitoxin (DNA-binding transcriptional repressor) of toxin-antitoxin stability system